jgi:hypothetical protein
LSRRSWCAVGSSMGEILCADGASPPATTSMCADAAPLALAGVALLTGSQPRAHVTGGSTPDIRDQTVNQAELSKRLVPSHVRRVPRWIGPTRPLRCLCVAAAVTSSVPSRSPHRVSPVMPSDFRRRPGGRRGHYPAPDTRRAATRATDAATRALSARGAR